MDSHREVRILQALEKIAENLQFIAEILQTQKVRNDGREETRSEEDRFQED
jgi:hypothetical protein